MTREQKASVVRSAGGSWVFEDLERVLRSSEQLSEMNPRGDKRAGGYWGRRGLE